MNQYTYKKYILYTTEITNKINKVRYWKHTNEMASCILFIQFDINWSMTIPTKQHLLLWRDSEYFRLHHMVNKTPNTLMFLRHQDWATLQRVTLYFRSPSAHHSFSNVGSESFYKSFHRNPFSNVLRSFTRFAQADWKLCLLYWY